MVQQLALAVRFATVWAAVSVHGLSLVPLYI